MTDSAPRRRRRVVVDIADCKVSGDPNDVLITYGLGSCVALVVWDPQLCIGGMIHVMLPMAKTDSQKSTNKPAMFADIGVPLLFDELFVRNCEKHRLVVKMIGGGQLMDDGGVFNVGRRNCELIERLLDKNQIKIQARDVGGQQSRTVHFHIDSGKALVKSQGEEREL